MIRFLLRVFFNCIFVNAVEVAILEVNEPLRTAEVLLHSFVVNLGLFVRFKSLGLVPVIIGLIHFHQCVCQRHFIRDVAQSQVHLAIGLNQLTQRLGQMTEPSGEWRAVRRGFVGGLEFIKEQVLKAIGAALIEHQVHVGSPILFNQVHLRDQVEHRHFHSN